MMRADFFQLGTAHLDPGPGDWVPGKSSCKNWAIRFFGFVNDQFKSGIAVHNPSETEAAQFTVPVKDMAGQEPVPEKTLTLAQRSTTATKFVWETHLSAQSRHRWN